MTQVGTFPSTGGGWNSAITIASFSSFLDPLYECSCHWSSILLSDLHRLFRPSLITGGAAARAAERADREADKETVPRAGTWFQELDVLKPPCYCRDHPYYLFWPFLVFSPGPQHPLSGRWKWPLHFTLPPRSTTLASTVFLTQVRFWELRTTSILGVGRSDTWS